MHNILATVGPELPGFHPPAAGERYLARSRREPHATFSGQAEWTNWPCDAFLPAVALELVVAVAEQTRPGADPQAAILLVHGQIVDGVVRHLRCAAVIKYLEPHPIEAGQTLERADPEVSIARLRQRLDAVRRQPVLRCPVRNAILRSCRRTFLAHRTRRAVARSQRVGEGWGEGLFPRCGPARDHQPSAGQPYPKRSLEKAAEHAKPFLP